MNSHAMLTRMILPLERLAEWEDAQNRRRSSWGIATSRAMNPGVWAVTLVDGTSALEGIKHLLERAAEQDDEATWVLVPPPELTLPSDVRDRVGEGVILSLADVTAVPGSPSALALDLTPSAESLRVLMESGVVSDRNPLAHWQLRKIEPNFTRSLRDHLATALETHDASHTLLEQALGGEPLRCPSRVLPIPDELRALARDLQLNPEQAEALHRSMTDPVTVIWGPPGTGKTTVITAILQACHARGEQVLLVSHTHQAVDEPLRRMVERWSQTPEGWAAILNHRIVRRGQRMSPTLTHSTIQGVPIPDLIHEDYRQRRQRRGQLWLELAQILHQAPDDGTLRQQWAAVAEKHAMVRTYAGEPWAVPPYPSPRDQQLVHREAALWARDPSQQYGRGTPSIVGATITHAFLSLTKGEWRPDVVIVDEATMAHLPALAAMALMAQRRVVFAGDFWQLPGIHPELGYWPLAEQGAAQEWITRDIFAVHGLSPTHNAPSAAVIMLREQHRMAAPVCDLVNALTYGHFAPLITATNPPAPCWPDSQSRLVLVDTTRRGAEPVADRRSWENPGHRQIIAEIVQQIRARDAEVTIGIVTPFRAQAWRLARLFAQDPGVTAATIHQFQGSERAIMILDPVRSPSRSHPFLGDGVEARRLWNVALSRAQRQVIVLGDLQWSGDASVMGQLIQIIRDEGEVLVWPKSVEAVLSPVHAGTGGF